MHTVWVVGMWVVGVWVVGYVTVISEIRHSNLVVLTLCEDISDSSPVLGRARGKVLLTVKPFSSSFFSPRS